MAQSLIIVEITSELSYPLFGGEPKPFLAAVVRTANGTSVSVSQYLTEYPEWGVDSIIGSNGMPRFVHGKGERAGISVGAVNDEIRDALNTHTKDLQLVGALHQNA